MATSPKDFPAKHPVIFADSWLSGFTGKLRAVRYSIVTASSVCGLLLLLLVSVPARALDPGMNVSQYAHTAWLVQDGYFPGAPDVIAQTTDGYLWIGTRSGLLRFDGTRFLPWTPPQGKSLPSNNIRSLLGARDGSLWIGTGAGIAHFVNDKLIEFPEFDGVVLSLLEEPSGKIWFTPESTRISSPMCEVTNEGIHCLDKSDGVSVSDYALPLVRDASGNIWIGGTQSLLRWKPGSFASFVPNGLGRVQGQDGVTALALAPDSSLWVGMILTGEGRGLQHFKDGNWKPIIEPGLDGTTLRVIALLVDRDAGLWVGTQNQGIYHIHGSHVDRFRAEDGLSANGVMGFYEDHEGGIWAVTPRGIDSFHQLQVVTYSMREGLSADNVVSVVASPNGTVWLANGDSLDSIQQGRISSVRSGRGLPGNEVTALFVDHAGHLWVGVDDDLFLYINGRFDRVRRRDGGSTRFVVGMTEDTNHDIWAEVSGLNRELIRIRDMQVVEEYPEAVIPSARLLATDRQGEIWLGLRDGNLARFRNGQAHVLEFPHPGSGWVRQVVANPDGSVLGATAYGLIAWRSDKTQTLTSRNGLPCNGTFGMSWDNGGALWLYTECGLIRIDKAEVQKWWANPDAIVASRAYDASDGVDPGQADYNPAAPSSDGKLWFANKYILQMMDPSHLVRNQIPPPIHIESLIADQEKFSPTEKLRLPPLMRNLEIEYTALSFVNPRKVKFRYMLEGRDAAWQDAGTRRQAFYNDLRPGSYRFRVVACNNDQVWNETGATVAFSIQPAWYQTYWFKIVCLTCTVGLISLLYRIRMRSYDKAMRTGFDERLSERTRVARELHDTLIQTIQASKLVADEVQDHLDDPRKTKRSLDKLSQWLAQAVEEGRTALEALRSSPPSEELSEELRHAAEDCASSSMHISVTVSGDVRSMHPGARGELRRIAFEAIRNACLHSGGSRLSIMLNYGRDLKIGIRDNGRGFDPDLIQSGKRGHFGILGMRERASRMGADLLITTSIQDGTQVLLVVPGRVIFPSSDNGWGWLLSKVRLLTTKR